MYLSWEASVVIMETSGVVLCVYEILSDIDVSLVSVSEELE